MSDVQGRCPACGGASLFLGEGGHVTCRRLDCPDPSAADDMLGEGAPMLHRVAVLASDLFMAGKPGPERETARKFLEALQRPEPRLLDCGFCYEEQGEEAHPHPECPEGRDASSPLRAHLVDTLRPWLLGADEADVEAAADAVLAAILTRTGIAAALTRMSDPAIARVRALHRKASHGETCVYCAHGQRLGYDTHWPCDTIRALDGTDEPKEQRERPTHPDGTPYRYQEMPAEGWGWFCNGCRMWSTATPERPHQCPETHMQGPVIGTARIALDVQPGLADGLTSEKRSDRSVTLPVVEFQGADVLRLWGGPSEARLVLARNKGARFTVDGVPFRYATSSAHPVIVEPLGPGVEGGYVTLTLITRKTTVNGQEVGDV